MDEINYQVIKQSLGNVIYSLKAHEKATDRNQNSATRIRWGNIVLVGLIFLVLFLQLFWPEEKGFLYAGITLTVMETLFLIFQLSFNPEQQAVKHQQGASDLWHIREKHLNLLTDIKNESLDGEAIIQARDTLAKELKVIYAYIPRTTADDYKKAGIALNGNEKPKADDEEMKKFLPEGLL